jgi:hypothetical protein
MDSRSAKKQKVNPTPSLKDTEFDDKITPSEKYRLDYEVYLQEPERYAEKERQSLVYRKKEIKQQLSLHKNTSTAHPHPLAPTSSLLCLQEDRSEFYASCNNHGSSDQRSFLGCTGIKSVLWSCDKCDYDICQNCYTFSESSEEQKQKIQKKNVEKIRKSVISNDLKMAEYEKEGKKEEMEMMKQIGGPFSPPLAHK